MKTVTVQTRNRRGDSWTEDTITAGTCRRLLSAAAPILDQSAPSKLNPSLPNSVALQIMGDAVAKLADDIPVNPLIASNVLRVALGIKSQRPIPEMLAMAMTKFGMKSEESPQASR